MNIQYGGKPLKEPSELSKKMCAEANAAYEIAIKRLNRQYYTGLLFVWFMLGVAIYLLTTPSQ